jgi:translocation and assembly module TamA
LGEHARRAAQVAILIAACMGAGIASGADPEPYTVKIDSTDNKALDTALKATSQLESLRTTAPAGPFALIGRAQSDVGRLETVMESFGYYRRQVSVTIAGRALDDPGLPALLQALPNSPPVAVQVRIDEGPLFHIRKVTFDGEVGEQARAAFALKEGAPALAADVLAAGTQLQQALQEEGHAYAKVDEPVAYMDASEPVLDVTYKVTPGPVYHLGAIQIVGLKRMHKAFVQRLLIIHPGDLYSPSKIEHARTDMLSLGVFSGMSVNLPKQEEVEDETLPITFQATERKQHAVSLQAAYSTDLGASGGATWTDRNTFGNAEILAITSSIINAGGNATTALGYQLGAALTHPSFLRTDQSLQYGVGILKQDLQAYNQESFTASVAINRTLSPRWKVGVGLTFVQEQVEQAPANNHYTLIALPITFKFDSTGLVNPLEDPRHGVRVAVAATPTQALNRTYENIIKCTFPSTEPACEPYNNDYAPGAVAYKAQTEPGLQTFVIMQGTIASYLDLEQFHWSQPGHSVIAVRAIAARVYGTTQFAIPPDQRLYGGGSATVRGFAYQSIGPTFEDTKNPEGGVELLAAGIELRQKLTQNIAGAAFIDTGRVTRTSGLFEASAKLDPYESGTGAGVGLRYYTPVGPVRVDIAFPLDATDTSGSFQVYIGLGQAF